MQKPSVENCRFDISSVFIGKSLINDNVLCLQGCRVLDLAAYKINCKYLNLENILYIFFKEKILQLNFLSNIQIFKIFRDITEFTEKKFSEFETAVSEVN